MLLSATAAQIAISVGVVLTFVTLWSVLHRPAAARWAQYWSAWFASNLLFYVVASLRVSGSSLGRGIAVLVLLGAFAQYASQVYLTLAVWTHAKPSATWLRARRAVWVLMAVQFVAPLVPAVSTGAQSLDTAQALFRLGAIAPYALCLAVMIDARSRVDRRARQLAIAAFAIGISRNAVLLAMQFSARAAEVQVQLPDAWNNGILALQMTATFSVCLASLYLLLVDERDTARSMVASQLGDRRLISLGRMASAVARDLERVLSDARRGVADARAATTRTALDAAANHITEAVSRGRDRGASLLAYARNVQPRIEHIGLRTWLCAERVDLSGTALGVLGLEIAPAGADPLVAIDRTLMHRVLSEVMENAREAGGSGVVTASVVVQPLQRRALLRLADDGVGIPAHQLAHATDPFFTTKGEGRAGLGLALSDTFVRQQGGVIRLRANEPRGTVVEIELPLASAPPMGVA